MRGLPNITRTLLGGRRGPICGAPAAPRRKTYSAMTGYAYQYYYEGWREVRPWWGAKRLEFLFRVSGDRKAWRTVTVVLPVAGVREWERAEQRKLSSTEQYAVAKMALLQAFDERAGPAALAAQVRVRNADIQGIVERLGL